MYEFNDVFSPPLSETNPNAVICAEPDIVPAGIVSPLLLTNPNAVICAEPLITSVPSKVLKTEPLIIPLPIDSYEDVAADKPSTCVWIDDVNTFKFSILVLEPDNTPLPANTCIEPLTKPAGKFVKLSKSTCSEPEITPSPPGLSTEPLTIPSPKSVAYLASNSVVNCADDDIIPPGSCSEDERIPVLPKT